MYKNNSFYKKSSFFFSTHALLTKFLTILLTVVSEKKFFKIKIDKILLKIDCIIRRLSGLDIINCKRDVNKNPTRKT